MNKNRFKFLLWNETVKSILQAIFFAVLIRTILFQPSTIPTGSMMPTLLIGDYIIINKFSYGYSKYSIPFSYNLFSGRIFGSKPERGDIVVFRLPRDPTIDYVKRLIGLPGDKISIKMGVIYINDIPVSHNRDGVFSYHYKEGWDENAPVFSEILNNGVKYKTISYDPLSSVNNTLDFVVPKGKYFMMGDNREDSLDSRYIEVGFIPEENLIGRASFILFSIGNNTPFNKVWMWLPNIRWDRFFKIL
ncbi:signal peptidase I [Candidatus Liberibacter americanus]|uniref:Signal peptidase I n=1 Tax=Candidatus Liberibacter americanus str. Sao Paulo TaxID=1261131 RepID=U6B588_9HYPH|nr:signal peptidase I [Candidatus Liberibacter americanus]AHA28075.1 Signal peptidase I [Candidatus Liberibacter americanus str. Sao Paulo]EMS35956.1 type I signal peptidase [Candidatus Liberibacter americanus PW_SP]